MFYQEWDNVSTISKTGSSKVNHLRNDHIEKKNMDDATNNHSDCHTHMMAFLANIAISLMFARYAMWRHEDRLF